MVKIKGKFLEFERTDALGYKFSKDCKISYPEKLPIIWNFQTEDPTSVLGHGEVIRTETGLEIDGVITSEIGKDVIFNDVMPILGLGGFYNKIISDKEDDKSDIRTVTSANLRYVSVTPSPVFKDYCISYGDILDE